MCRSSEAVDGPVRDVSHASHGGQGTAGGVPCPPILFTGFLTGSRDWVGNLYVNPPCRNKICLARGSLRREYRKHH